MTSGAGEFRRAGTRMQSTSWAGCDMPRPLHITKRSSIGRSNRIARNPRGCSPESDLSDATTDSPTELPGGNRPLTIPKRRGDRGGWAAHRTRGRDGTAERADGWNPPSVDPCLGCSLADVEQLRRHPTLLLLSTLVGPHHAQAHTRRGAMFRTAPLRRTSLPPCNQDRYWYGVKVLALKVHGEGQAQHTRLHRKSNRNITRNCSMGKAWFLCCR